MENKWTHRYTARLYSEDSPQLREFIEEFHDRLYTWVFYRTSGDEDVAFDLTLRILQRTLADIQMHYDLRIQPLYDWIKEISLEEISDYAAGHNLTFSIPIDTAQISPSDWQALGAIHREPLTDGFVSKETIGHVLQAVFAELTSELRIFLLHRYSYMDTPDRIADSLDMTEDQVADGMYRAQHGFRRALTAFIQRLTGDKMAAQQSPPIPEVMEANFEKLFSAIEPVLHLSDEQTARLCVELENTAQRIRHEHSRAVEKGTQTKRLIWAGIGCAGLVAAVLFWWLFSAGRQSQRLTDEFARQIVDERSGVSVDGDVEEVDQDLLKRQLMLVMEYGKNQDIEGLVRILRNGYFSPQMAAAIFLKNFGDVSAINPLSDVESRYFPNGPADNAFAQAIEAIEQRMRTAAKVVDDWSNEQPLESEAELGEKVLKAQPLDSALSGTVADFFGIPLAGANIQLATIRYNTQRDAYVYKPFVDMVTDEKGRYEVNQLPKDLSVLTWQNADMDYLYQRNIWPVVDMPLDVNLGGRPLLAGTVAINDVPLTDALLYFSDSIELSLAAEYSMIRTNEQGGFIFTDFEPDHRYYVMIEEGPNAQLVPITQLTVDAGMAGQNDLKIRTYDVLVSVDRNGLEDVQVVRAELLNNYPLDQTLNRWTMDLPNRKTGLYKLRAVYPGTYHAVVILDNGMMLVKQVEVPERSEKDFVIDFRIPNGSAELTGKVLNDAGLLFELWDASETLRMPIIPDEQGRYGLFGLPTGVYRMGVVYQGALLELMRLELGADEPVVYDIDSAELLGAMSPLRVLVTDTAGRVLSGAQIWLNNENSIQNKFSTGLGAIFGVDPGTYKLSVVAEGYSLFTDTVEVAPGAMDRHITEIPPYLVRLRRN